CCPGGPGPGRPGQEILSTLPHLTRASAPLVQEVRAVNEFGEACLVSIPAERALTVYVDKRELVTLMTLGAHPELLVLGFLRNQRLVQSVHEVESITVDWDVGAAAVKTRAGISDIASRTAKKVVTTGCGQGSVFGDLMAEVDQLQLPPATLTQAQLYGIVNAIRLQESTYKSAGSVHGCALFQGEQMLIFVEDVGRHNAIDTIAGWMSMQEAAPTLAAARAALPPGGASFALGRPGGETAASAEAGMSGADKVFYTTGRLTSEMVIKSAQMGVPIVVSRSGITQMGQQLAQTLGLCTIGRAMNRRFLCYSASDRLLLQPELAKPGV
ncbi:MAG: hypothetical protein RIS90_1328, partial [Pseudomonadota bacterium]